MRQQVVCHAALAHDRVPGVVLPRERLKDHRVGQSGVCGPAQAEHTDLVAGEIVAPAQDGVDLQELVLRHAQAVHSLDHELPLRWDDGDLDARLRAVDARGCPARPALVVVELPEARLRVGVEVPRHPLDDHVLLQLDLDHPSAGGLLQLRSVGELLAPQRERVLLDKGGLEYLDFLCHASKAPPETRGGERLPPPPRLAVSLNPA